MRLTGNNAYDWQCTHTTSVGDDANAVCAWTYWRALSQATNSVTNFNNPNSRECWA